MERINFIAFKTKFIKKERNALQASILAPIVYNFEDEFYNPVLKYLEDGIETNICSNGIDINQIKEGMNCAYIQAACVLHNVKMMPQYSGLIFEPKIIE